MPGTVTRTAFLAALRVLEPELIPEYEQARSRTELRFVIDRALAAYRTQAKRCHPDQGGSQQEFIRVTRARDVVLLAREALAVPPPRVEFNRAMRHAVMHVTINGVPIDVMRVTYSEWT